MSKVSSMKMKVMPNPDQLAEQIGSLRTKIYVGQGSEIHNEVMDWVKNINFVYGTQEGEDATRPSVVGKPYKAQCKRMEAFPAGLRKLKNFLMINRNIPPEEIHAAVITVYPPPRSSSNYENLLESALMLTRDRFIYIANSDEMISYVMQNPDKLKQMFGMQTPKNMLSEIPEHVERGNVYHLNQTSAVSLSWKFNDANAFKKQIRNGKGFREVSFEKRVRARYVIVIDLLMNAQLFKATIKDTIGMIGDIAEDEKGTAKGKFAKETLERIRQDMKIAKETDENQNEDEDEPPELVPAEESFVVVQPPSQYDGIFDDNLSSIERLQNKIIENGESVFEEVCETITNTDNSSNTNETTNTNETPNTDNSSNANETTNTDER